MKTFINDNFLLHTKTAQRLYHDYAKEIPIIDYHNHLSPSHIANDLNFENITQAWLNGDHYKWRAMRSNGINEKYVTGNASDWEKFEKWATTVPYTLRNPLHHWTHLELLRYFGIDEILNPSSAKAIYEECNSKLVTNEFSTRNLLKSRNIEVVCTTDDPTDSLEYHQSFQGKETNLKMLPTFRPDKAMAVDDAENFNNYVKKLEEVTNISVNTYSEYLTALKNRHDFFASVGCKVSDHGVEEMYADDYTEAEINSIFNQLRNAKQIDTTQSRKIKSALLKTFAEWNCEKNWVQQFHIGPIRNNNSRMFQQLGADTGWDSMGRTVNPKSVSRFLDNLDKNNRLAKTILYSINPADNEMLATMIGNFNDGTVAGKIQLGAAWWFNDQKDGIIKHLDALSNMGLLSRFVGMLTDSRSFLSFPRHEYFRRILCNVLGDEIEKGELPNDEKWIGHIVQNICYNNAKEYFNF